MPSFARSEANGPVAALSSAVMPDRPPSVDALARELADVGLPHPLLVDAARAAIAAGDPSSARAISRAAWSLRDARFPPARSNSRFE